MDPAGGSGKPGLPSGQKTPGGAPGGGGVVPEGATLRPGPGGSVGGEPRPGGPPLDAELVEGPRARGLDHEIGLAASEAQLLELRRVAEVQEQVGPAGVEQGEQLGVTHPGTVGPGGALHLGHLGPGRGQDRRGEGAGPQRREVDHPAARDPSGVPGQGRKGGGVERPGGGEGRRRASDHERHGRRALGTGGELLVGQRRARRGNGPDGEAELLGGGGQVAGGTLGHGGRDGVPGWRAIADRVEAEPGRKQAEVARPGQGDRHPTVRRSQQAAGAPDRPVPGAGGAVQRGPFPQERRAVERDASAAERAEQLDHHRRGVHLRGDVARRREGGPVAPAGQGHGTGRGPAGDAPEAARGDDPRFTRDRDGRAGPVHRGVGRHRGDVAG